MDRCNSVDTWIVVKKKLMSIPTHDIAEKIFNFTLIVLGSPSNPSYLIVFRLKVSDTL